MSRSPAFATAICLLLTCAAAAQTPTKTARIEMLCPVRCAGSGYTAFDDELRKRGWIEGSTLTIERISLEGRYERVSELAAEIVRSRPDLIVGPGAPIARALKEATSEIPIAFSFVADPVGIGLVQSLARPGRNVTGVAAITPGTFLAKQFEILRELLPQAQRVAILTNPANDDYRLTQVREVPMALQLGWQIDVIEVRAPDEVPAAVAKARTLGALWEPGASPSRGAGLLHSRHYRDCSSPRTVRGPHLEGSISSGHARRAADTVQPDGQPQDCKGAWAHDTGVTPRPCRRGD